MSKKKLKLKITKMVEIDPSTGFGKIFYKINKALGKGKVKKANKILCSIKNQEGFLKWVGGLAE